MVTEPNVGSETLKIKTTAVKRDGKWYLDGQKVRSAGCQRESPLKISRFGLPPHRWLLMPLY